VLRKSTKAEHEEFWGSRRCALEFNVDVICHHPTTLHAPLTDSTKAARPNILPRLSSAAARTGIEPSVVFTPICA
jgi:hypothetical protein